MGIEVSFLKDYPNCLYLYELFKTTLILYPDLHLSPEGEDQALGSLLWATQHKYQQILIEQPLLNSGPETQG